VIYAVRHRTTYSYDNEAPFARCVLRLTPQSSPVQTLEYFAVTVLPQPSRTDERTGPFGERAITMVIEEGHDTLVVEANSQVDVHAAAVEHPADSPTLETLRAMSLGSEDMGFEGPAAFLYPTNRTPLTPAITDYARLSLKPGRPVIEAAAELMGRIRADFTYDPEATNNATTPGQAFAARHGVCQDFTNIMICGLRGLGLPAAYVTGYLRTVPPAGKPRLEGSDASHAWVRLWCGPERGWIGFDPTNNLYVQNDHITLMAGRDSSDTAPIEGVLLGSGEQALKVEVDVIPQDDATVLRPSFAPRSASGPRG